MTSPSARLVTALSILALGCAKDKPRPAPPVPVTVASAARKPVPFELTAVGTVEPMQTVAVQAQVNGQLIRVTFHEGDEVETGQVLFQIDPRPFQAALDQTQAILARDKAQAENAEQELKRFASLAEKDYITAQQLDQSRANAAASVATLAADQASVDQARLNLQYATIRAPIAGRTGSLLVRQGNLVRTDGVTLVTINQIRPILTRFAVPASNLGLLQQYRTSRDLLVQATPTSGGATSDGTLSFVDNAVDSTTGTILLKGNFPNQNGSLWPGEFVNVSLRVFLEQDALVVPTAAIMSGQQGFFLFTIMPDSTAAMQTIKVEREAGDYSVITGPVNSDDRVVTDGQLLLHPGAKVQIRTAAPSPRQETQP